MSSLPDPTPDPGLPEALEVYWRPGCTYCSRLLRRLDKAGVTVRRHNIWEDAAARRFVRDHNRGDETVPTVDLAGDVRTNPSPGALIEHIGVTFPHLLRDPAVQGTFWGFRRQRA